MDKIVNPGEIVTGVLTNICEDGIKHLWNKVRKYFKDADTQASIDLGIAYEEYIIKTKNKYGKIKTIIYNRTPKDLYSFYECVGLKYDSEVIDTKDINNVIKISNKIIITGTGGIGKSTMLKHFFLNTLEITDYVPLLVELRTFNNNADEISLYKEIHETLSINGFNVEENCFDYSLNEGGYIFLFDGFDELNATTAKLVSKEIQKFADKFSNNHFIISSRNSEEFIGWHDFTELRTLALNKEQAISLITKLEFDQIVKTRFISELEETLFDKHQSFAENPLLLTIMLLTYESNAKIPENLNDFYERAFLALFSMHDATKESFSRETHTGLSYDNFKTIFSYLCFQSHFKCVYEFSDVKLIEYINEAQQRFPEIKFSPQDFQMDLTQHVCMLIKDGLIYRFSHRSFQEYFAACYTCKLTDDNQKKLLQKQLSKFESSSMFYAMLFNMQNERFNFNVIIPGIEEIKHIFDLFGESLETVKSFYGKIDITVRDKSQDDNPDLNYEMRLTIKNKYLYNILNYAIILNNLKSRIERLSIERQTIRRSILKELIKKQYGSCRNGYYYSFEFEQIEPLISPEDIEVLFFFLFSEIKCLVEFYDEYTIHAEKYSSFESLLSSL